MPAGLGVRLKLWLWHWSLVGNVALWVLRGSGGRSSPPAAAPLQVCPSTTRYIVGSSIMSVSHRYIAPIIRLSLAFCTTTYYSLAYLFHFYLPSHRRRHIKVTLRKFLKHILVVFVFAFVCFRFHSCAACWLVIHCESAIRCTILPLQVASDRNNCNALNITFVEHSYTFNFTENRECAILQASTAGWVYITRCTHDSTVWLGRLMFLWRAYQLIRLFPPCLAPKIERLPVCTPNHGCLETSQAPPGEFCESDSEIW